MKNVILGVTASIAAYKAAEIANRLHKDGFNVEVIMTEGAMKFIAPLTFSSLTKNRVYTDIFDEKYPREVQHISLAQKADAFLIAPATADVIGKIASGIADDMLTTVVMAVHDIPVIIAPAMNTYMYENAIVQDNISKLKRFGYEFIEPREAMLACGTIGKGALAEPEVIVAAVEARLNKHQ